MFPGMPEYYEEHERLDKFKLDAALVFEPTPLGFGFRVGFLGLLHMDVVRRDSGSSISPVY